MRRLASVLAAVFTSVLVAPATTASAGIPTGLPAWDRVPSPNVGAGDNQLYGVDARAADDIWAVGYSTEGLHDQPLIEHFDGQSWSLATVPEIPDGDFGSVLLGIDALSPTDVWAVGGHNDDGDSLIMHWDGVEWQSVEHPTPGTYHRLYGVAAIATNNVWAVGELSTAGGISRTHILHWNGTRWSVVPSPIGPDGGYNQLLAVEAVAPDDIWAVGADGPRALALHWNGTAWGVVATPPPPSTFELAAISAVGPNDVWAVGDAGATALTMHWDGTQWTVVPGPDGPGPVGEDLHGVIALAANDVWAVGHDGDTLAAHWDGTTWSIVPTVDRDDPNFLRAVTAVNPGNVIAVGEADFATLVERWNGTRFRVEPSANRGTGFNQLLGVHANAPNDVWTVGTAQDKTLTQHWDGTAFTVVPSPSVAGRDNILTAADGTRPDDVWAVGHHDDSDFIGARTLALHWNGTAWLRTPTPSKGGATDQNELLAVAAVASDDVWAVGSFVTFSSSRALILHWDGDRWNTVGNRCGARLSGITAFSATDIWAIGSATSCHWDGVRWTPIPVAPAGDGRSTVNLADIDGAATDDLWAVGTKASQCGEGVCVTGEIQHWNGNRWAEEPTGPPPLTSVDVLSTGDAWAVGLGALPVLWHYDGSSWSAAPEPDLDSGSAELRAVEATGPDDVWSAGTLRTGTLMGSSLVLHARAPDSGAVVGDTDVAGAVVSWFGSETGSVETDAFGNYRVGGLDAGRSTFIVTAPGCTPGSSTIRVRAGTTIIRNLTLSC